MGAGEIVEGVEEEFAYDGTVDYIAMVESILTVESFTEMVLGVILVLIVTVLPVMTALELAYINLPTFQSAIEKIDIATEGSRNRLVGLMLRDARRSVELSVTDAYGRNVNFIYLKRKLFIYIFAAIYIVSMLGGGNIAVNIISDIIYGFKDAFRNM